MYRTATIKQLYKDILKSILTVYDSVIEWCANREGINFLSFTVTVNNLNIAMQQASTWHDKFENVKGDAEVLYLQGQCDQKAKLADTLLGKIGDESNYTIHKSGDNEGAKEILTKGILELDAKLRAFGKT